MDILQSIAVYIFIWWITLFLVLPFGVRTQQEEGSVVPGTPESAPASRGSCASPSSTRRLPRRCSSPST